MKGNRPAGNLPFNQGFTEEHLKVDRTRRETRKLAVLIHCALQTHAAPLATFAVETQQNQQATLWLGQVSATDKNVKYYLLYSRSHTRATATTTTVVCCFRLVATAGPVMIAVMVLACLLSVSKPAAAVEPITVAALLVSMSSLGFTVGNTFWAADDKKASEFCKTVVDSALRINPEYRYVCVHNRIRHRFGGAHNREYLELKQTFGNRGYFLYSISVNHAGEFDLQGDGGFINWAWGGSQIKQHSRKKLEFLCRDGRSWPAC